MLDQDHPQESVPPGRVQVVGGVEDPLVDALDRHVQRERG